MDELIKSEIVSLVNRQDRYPVDFDRAWPWVGYSRKDPAKRAILAQFAETTHFHITVEVVERAQGGGSPVEKIWLTADCFKEFCMMAGTERGREVRAYFIQCEQQLKSIAEEDPQLLVARALIAADGIIKKQAAQIAVLAPKAEVYDAIGSARNDHTISQVAKVLGYGQRKFFALLRSDRILQKGNIPYQQFLDHGYFRVVARPIQKGPRVENHLQDFCDSHGHAISGPSLHAHDRGT